MWKDFWYEWISDGRFGGGGHYEFRMQRLSNILGMLAILALIVLNIYTYL